jgi:hypothetical protein
MADQTYTDTDAVLDLVVEAIYGPADYPAPAPDVNAFGGRLRRKATAVLDVMVAARWAPRAAAAADIADALDAQLQQAAPRMSPAYRDGYYDAARFVRNRGAEAGRG